MYTTENFNQNSFKPSRFVSEGHELVINGQKIQYKTIAEDNVFYDKTGKAIATIYSYSYFRTDVTDTKNRPVVFGFNGGPGTSSMYVHAGFLGAKRIKYDAVDRETSLPPYEVIDNPNSLLDIADIVLVDPVNTGYGALLDETAGNQFFGIEQDAEAFLNFVEKWLHRYNRFLSPKYLIGESYGCTRASVSAGMAVSGSKNRSFALSFDGLVLIGNTVTPNQYFGKGMPAETSVVRFTTYAAINWYHNHPTAQPIWDFLKEAKQFANTEYMLALHQGEALSDEAREEIIKKVSYYTGLDHKYLSDNAMKIVDSTFRQEVCKDKGYAVSRLDGRISRPFYKPQSYENARGGWDDALDDRYDSYFLSALCGKILPEMGIELDRPYVAAFNPFGPTNPNKWNFDEPSGVTGAQLNAYMRKAFGSRVFFANGCYDGATYTGYIDYLTTHGGLPTDRLSLKEYQSGHMIYLGEDNIKELADDVRAFLNGALPTNK